MAARFGPEALGLTLVLAFAFARICALFATPLELYPDEAQYWLWSQAPALGYVSKPPMIAWLIRATTALGGDAEPWVRLSAPLCHGLAAVALQRAGARLYGPWAGLWAGVVYSLMPGVQLSSAVIATDAPLMACLGLAVWAYAVWWTAADPRERRGAAMALGAALGAATLAKYAAVYVLLGLLLHAVVSREARRRWRRGDLAAAVGVLVLIVAPNLVWNGLHGFATLSHTAQSADWNQPTELAVARSAFDPRQAPGFFGSQFGVFGPIAFAVFLWAGADLVRRRASGRASGADAADGLCLSLALPALLIVLVEAGLARANANWAAAAYAPGSVLVAGWLCRQDPRVGRPIRIALVISQALLTLAFLTFLVRPDLADRAGFSNSLKRARGWAETARVTLERAAVEPGLTALAADDRFLFNALAYYGRDALARPGAPALKMWVREIRPLNEAEATRPLVAADGGRVLVAAITYPREAAADFRAVRDPAALDIALDARRLRRLGLFVGEGFAPLPRDPVTGLPPRP